ncbi:MAG: PstS family phosphate ABC transporter substrate-binding protein [Gaiellaceae bacterium]
MWRVAFVLLLVAGLTAGCRERPGDQKVNPEDQISDKGAYEPFGEEALRGRVSADGSSTVAPLVTLAAERFGKANPKVKVTVGIAGTGGGFERFCREETDLSNASRPIEEDERALCAKQHVSFLELQVANDGLSLAVNPDNDWVDCLTVDQLKRIWEPGSRIKNWRDLDSRFPDQELKLYGPGTDSGTFDYFTKAIVGEEGMSRSDYTASEDDNVTVRGVSGEQGALGYLGLSYVEESGGALKALAIDGGDGCVTPSVETVQSGEYKPLSRPLLIYANRDAVENKAQVDEFLRFILDNQRRLARGALFVPLTADQLEKSRTILEGAAIDAGQG